MRKYEYVSRTEREQRTLKLARSILGGMTVQEASGLIGVSRTTAHSYIENILPTIDAVIFSAVETELCGRSKRGYSRQRKSFSN